MRFLKVDTQRRIKYQLSILYSQLTIWGTIMVPCLHHFIQLFLSSLDRTVSRDQSLSQLKITKTTYETMCKYMTWLQKFILSFASKLSLLLFGITVILIAYFSLECWIYLSFVTCELIITDIIEHDQMICKQTSFGSKTTTSKSNIYIFMLLLDRLTLMNSW